MTSKILMALTIILLLFASVVCTTSTWGKPYTPMILTYVPWYGWVTYAGGMLCWFGWMYDQRN